MTIKGSLLSTVPVAKRSLVENFLTPLSGQMLMAFGGKYGLNINFHISDRSAFMSECVQLIFWLDV